MKTLLYLSLLVSAVFLTGCSTFQVKNTEGLRLAYEDIDRSTSKAVELRKLKNITDQQRNEASDLYRDAKSSINSYLQQAITDAADYVVDNPVDGYLATQSTEKVSVFRKKVNELRGSAPAPVDKSVALVIPWIPPAVTVITEIKKLHDQSQKAAYERFEKTVKESLMKNYEELPSAATEK